MRRMLVEDQRMPTGVDWMVVRETNGEQHLFVRRSCCEHDCDACPVLQRVEAMLVAG